MPTLPVIYEHIRIAPKGEWTDELLAQTLEESLRDHDTVEPPDHDDNPPITYLTSQHPDDRTDDQPESVAQGIVAPQPMEEHTDDMKNTDM